MRDYLNRFESTSVVCSIKSRFTYDDIQIHSFFSDLRFLFLNTFYKIEHAYRPHRVSLN